MRAFILQMDDNTDHLRNKEKGHQKTDLNKAGKVQKDKQNDFGSPTWKNNLSPHT
jgi:hypothetical protein